MIAVVDYGMGNLHSVAKALEAAGGDVRVTTDAADLERAERIVLPGVGAFRDCIGALRATGLVDTLRREVIDRRKPFLGICLGFQLLARHSTEGGDHVGLGWIDAEVVRLPKDELGLPVPHMGWNDVTASPGAFLFRDVQEPVFYFAHSYFVRVDDVSSVMATTKYGLRFPVTVQTRNIVGVQFHPEKSQGVGLRLLENFLAWSP